jgi:NAD(P)H dehydrogenase (quinone)
MILVTGASGKTGRAVLRALTRRGERTRALTRQAVLDLPGEVVQGDLSRADDLARAMRGVDKVYHIPPNMFQNEVELGEIVLNAAQNAGVERFVYHSVLHPQTEEMPHHWNKLRVEERILRSGLNFTILQPCAYMQNILGYWDKITREGIYGVPYAVSTRLSLVDLEDVGEAAAKVLCEAGHAGATYELAGPQALSQDEIAQRIAEVLGKPVTAQALERGQWEASVRARGMVDYEVATLLKMFTYYEKYGFRGNPNMLRYLLGREPRTFADFLYRLLEGDWPDG